MARHTLAFFVFLGCVGAAAGMHPSNDNLPLASMNQASMIQMQAKQQLAEMVTNKLMEELESDIGISSMIKEVMTSLGKDLLHSLKPVVEETCAKIVDQLTDASLIEVSPRVADIAPHEQDPEALVEFLGSAKDVLKGAFEKAKKAVSKVKEAASPILEKAKTMLVDALKSYVKKITPILEEKAAEMVSKVCERTVEAVEGEA